MILPAHKTKIVATIGPASESPEMLERLIRAGLNIARLNFSHGDFTKHGEVIARIRAAERGAGKRVAIMADLPGPRNNSLKGTRRVPDTPATSACALRASKAMVPSAAGRA